MDASHTVFQVFMGDRKWWCVDARDIGKLHAGGEACSSWHGAKVARPFRHRRSLLFHQASSIPFRDEDGSKPAFFRPGPGEGATAPEDMRTA
jgi:hypothetical protein